MVKVEVDESNGACSRVHRARFGFGFIPWLGGARQMEEKETWRENQGIGTLFRFRVRV